MPSMSDDDYDEAFDIEYIDHDTAQQVIQWAYETASLIFLMRFTNDHDTVEEGLVRLEQLLDGLSWAIDEMPEHLAKSGRSLALGGLEQVRAEDEETLVEKFRKEIEEL